MQILCKVRRVVVFSFCVDFRKRFDGLLSICYQHGYNPYEGDCVVFTNKRFRQVSVLLGDELGLYLIQRRFEGGGKLRDLFQKEFLTDLELSFLLQGSSFQVKSHAKAWK